MTTRNIPQLLEIEKHSSEQLWTRSDFSRHLKKPNCDGYVLQKDSVAIAFLCYEYFPSVNRFLIWNIVVHSSLQRKGFGRQLLISFFNNHSKNSDGIYTNVRESNLDAHLFLKRLGFQAWAISKDYFVDSVYEQEVREDAYCFKYRAAVEDFSLLKDLGKPLKRNNPSEKTKRLGKRVVKYDKL